MRKYRITKEGDLVELHYDLIDKPKEEWSDSDYEWAKRFKNFTPQKRVNESWKTVDFHGFFQFYTSVDDVWYEIKAKFTDGKLVALTWENPPAYLEMNE